jgi:hypothetical protein
MSTHALAGDFPERNHSAHRLLGFVASALPVLVELEPEATEQQLAAAVRPDWWTGGTLSGVMAGKRPAR